MYILYLDESGTTPEASYFVLAGLAAFERETYWFTKDLNDLQSEYFPNIQEPVLFRAAVLHTRSEDSVEPPWDQLPAERRRELKSRIYSIIRSRKGIIFGCAVEREYATTRSEDPYERAFEDLISRFDLFLTRTNRELAQENREEQRGLIVIAESNYQKTLGILARRLHQTGTRWGQLHNMADIPFFAPARDTRLLQFADFCANAIYGRYARGLSSGYDMVAGKIDNHGGVLHGLAHLTRDLACGCTACFSRRGRQLLPQP